MKAKLLLIISLVTLVYFISCNKKNSDNYLTTPLEESTSTTPKKKDTVIFVNTTADEYEEFMKDVAMITDNFFKTKDTLKLYIIHNDTLLIHKRELRHLIGSEGNDVLESLYIYNGDTLSLYNDCTGEELININDSLKIIYSYSFDCIESSSYNKIRYYCTNNDFIIHEDSFEEEWILEYINESKIKSKRKETLFIPNRNPQGFIIEKIETTTNTDTIKIYTTDQTNKIATKVIKKLLPERNFDFQ
jgi:hypothetical protein